MEEKKYYCMRYYVTYRCNSRCQYCNVWQDSRFRERRELELEEAKSLIAQCYQIGVRYIDFTGGEPTLNRNLAEMIGYAKSLGIKTEVTTNGIPHLTGNLQEIAASADKFNLSLDTLNPDKYCRIRGVDCLDKVLETMEELAPVRPPKIMMVISRENVSELEQMICFARRHHAEVYLNPVFSYFDTACGGECGTVIPWIISKIFEPYTVVMLHFMEFLKNTGAGNRPPCSANSRTLTFAPDGGLILPCYHAVKETVPWSGNLANMLETDVFKRYAYADFQRECSGTCGVIPYFGISINYRLDAYFLIQSYSEKLNHLKRDYLNRLSGLEIDGAVLQHHLSELLSIIRSLERGQEHEFTGLYWAEETTQGYRTDVYRELLTKEQYRQEQEAEDCWGLKLVPHYEFDKIVNRFYPKAYAVYQAGAYREEISGIFQDAMEFQLRLWKAYISKHMKVAVVCSYEEERNWLERYVDRLLRWEQGNLGYAGC